MVCKQRFRNQVKANASLSICQILCDWSTPCRVSISIGRNIRLMVLCVGLQCECSISQSFFFLSSEKSNQRYFSPVFMEKNALEISTFAISTTGSR